jgi:tetratricopeptide (TPR) repeat protein
MTASSNHSDDDESIPGRIRGVLQILGVLGLTLATVTAGTGVAAGATADDALEAKKEAEQLHATLVELDEQSAVAVDQSVLESVEYNLERGRLDFTNDNYGDATDHFETAIEQARAELADAYVDAAAVSLDVVDQRVTAVTERGYQTDETAALTAQVENERAELEGVDSYADARQAYEDAQALRERAAALPTSEEVSTANWLDSVSDSLVLLVGGGLLGMTVLGAGGWLAYTAVRSDREEEIRTH